MPETTFDDLARAEIRAEMARQDITQKELARRLQWPLTTLHRRLRGKTPIGASHLQQIATELDVPMERFGFIIVSRRSKAGQS